MCHLKSSGVALGESLGIGKGSVKLEDLYEAEVIMILGQNPGTNHPRMLTALQKAKKNGAKIISINPLPETGLMGFNNPQKIGGLLGISTQLTDLYLPVKINGDLACYKLLSYSCYTKNNNNPAVYSIITLLKTIQKLQRLHTPLATARCKCIGDSLRY